MTFRPAKPPLVFRPLSTVLRPASFILLSLALLACRASTEATPTLLAILTPTSSMTTPVFVKGVGLSPVGFPNDYSQWDDFYAEVGSWGNGSVLWNGAWREDEAGGSDAGQTPQAAASVMQLASRYHFTPLVVFGWRSGTTLYLNVPANATNTWSNTEAQQLYQSMLSDFAATYQPPYIFLGNESDFYLEQNAADYANWITVYNQAYAAIKTASPDTLIGPVFNYEHLSGQGVLTGWSTPHWEALESHDLAQVDIVGLTVYPFFQYTAPEAVPADYLEPLFQRIGSKPIAITETGWPADSARNPPPPWVTSEAAQVTYLAQLKTMLTGKSVKVVNWLFLNGMTQPESNEIGQLFGSIALRDQAGKPYAVLEEWIEFEVE